MSFRCFLWICLFLTSIQLKVRYTPPYMIMKYFLSSKILCFRFIFRRTDAGKNGRSFAWRSLMRTTPIGSPVGNDHGRESPPAKSFESEIWAHAFWGSRITVRPAISCPPALHVGTVWNREKSMHYFTPPSTYIAKRIWPPILIDSKIFSRTPVGIIPDILRLKRKIPFEG